MYRYTLQWLIAILFVLSANVANAAYSAFLCITDQGYSGEASAPGFAKCSELIDFGQTGFVDGSTPIARAIKVDKIYDTMSNALRTAMTNLTTLNEVKIRVINMTASSTLEFYDLRLLGAHVDSAAVSTNAAGNGILNETIGFSAAYIEITYRPTKAGNMGLGTAVYTCWNVAANTATNNPCP